MARQKQCITIGNSISGSPDPLALRALGFAGSEPYQFLCKEPTGGNEQPVWPFEFLYKPTCCPNDCKRDCSSRDHFMRSGHRKPVKYVHVSSGSSPQTIQVFIPRWFAACGEVVPPSPLPGMADGYLMTLPAIVFAIRELKAGTPVAFLARILNESVSTMYRIKDKHLPKAQQLELCIDPTMESLGIDEIKIGKTYYTILVDNTHRRFIGLIKGMAENHIKQALIEIREKCDIKRATADFSRGYIAILRAYFPGIVITGDKYHFLEKIKEKITKLRRKAANALTQEKIDEILTALNISVDDEEDEEDDEDEEEYDAVVKTAKSRSAAGSLKRDAYLFQTKFSKLTSDQKIRLNIWLKMVPQMRAPYRFLQRLYSLLDQRRLCPSKCYQRLCKLMYQLWDDSPEQFFKLKGFLRNHFEEIVAYFDTREDNAFAESMNRQIREIIRLARGLHPEEINRRMCDRYGMVVGVSRATDSGSRHGLHRRKRWPLESLEKSGNPQLLLRFEEPKAA